MDWVLPPAIIGFSFWGLYISVFEVGAGWLGCHTDRIRYATIHILFSIVTVLSIIILIFVLWTLPTDHDVPPTVAETTAQAWLSQYVHECFSEDGTPTKCNRGSCGGRVKPPRTHHCSVCGTCRLEWDHHCPWVGSCLTFRQSKAFLVLLAITGLGVWIMALPVIHPILDGAYSMYTVSRADAKSSRLWWDWWGSYVVFGGPGGRWVLGTALGYWIAELDEPPNPQRCRFGLLFMKPNFSVAVTLAVALSLAAFCTVLALQMWFRLLRGQTTIEALQSQTYPRTKETIRYLWIPESKLSSSTDISGSNVGTRLIDSAESLRHRAQQPLEGQVALRGTAFPIYWDERIYDLGAWSNAKKFNALPIFGSRHNHLTLPEPPVISHRIIERLTSRRGDN
ncbi:hypothetical protein FRC12_005223 [Ceratobasidium sp. 428]|nr:hypothetical protein FRC12_005223 [Ceratobasidium sp. 428]